MYLFCAKVRIWIDLGEKYGTKFGLLIIQEMLIFRVIITNFGTLRMHHIARFLSCFYGGACPRSPLAQLWMHIITRLAKRLVCYSLSWLLDGGFSGVIKTLVNVDQIYSYLLYMELRIGPK